MIITAQERLRAFRARNAEYLRVGHDRLAAARFVVDAAGPLHGPALDVGTGKGLLAIELARQGLEVVSIDVDAKERELARLLADEARLKGRIAYDTGDAARLPYADGSFGCVAMMDVLHHLAELRSVLHEMARVAADGGIIVIADFDADGFELVSRVHQAEGREHPRTGATMSSALAELTRVGLHRVTSANGYQHEVEVLRKQNGRKESKDP